MATFDYYPFGLLMPDRYTVNNNTTEKFTGKELDSNLDLYYFGARYYDPALGRWHSVDPLTGKYPSLSPYNYAADNPLMFVDPNGGFLNPIYDEEGNFLGTDDRGLQGEAIVMNKENFKQGMSHEAALEKGSLLSDLPNDFSSAIINKIERHQSGLSSRPDWDGTLFLGEVNQWYTEGSGKPLYADLDKIDLKMISVSDFNKGQDFTYFNLLAEGNIFDGPVYGTIGLKYIGSNKVKGSYDIYDFDMKSWNSVSNIFRNFEAIIGSWVSGSGKPFTINFYGKGTVSY